MGAGNRLDPTKFVVSDISKTHSDPLAKVMRKKLKEAGVKNLNVFSLQSRQQNLYIMWKRVQHQVQCPLYHRCVVWLWRHKLLEKL